MPNVADYGLSRCHLLSLDLGHTTVGNLHHLLLRTSTFTPFFPHTLQQSCLQNLFVRSKVQILEEKVDSRLAPWTMATGII